MSLLLNVPAKYNAYQKIGIIAQGYAASHSLFINGFTKAWGWGLNSSFQLGDNTNIFRYSPVLIALYGINKTFCQIGVGAIHSVGIDKNGRAWGWGANANGRIGDNTTTTRCYPVLVQGAVKTFCRISAGNSFSLAIDKNGRAWTWGLNTSGQLGDNSVTSRLTPVSVLGAIKTFCRISTGNTHSLAIDKNGRAWGWGANTAGPLGDNSITSKLTPVSVLGAIKTFCQISAGNSFSLAIDKNGRAWAWGNNSSGQLGDNSVTSKLTPVSVLGAIKTFCQISTGTSISLAIDKNGRAWGWGANSSGQLGDNSITSKLTPVSVLGAIKTFCQISAGASHSLAIDKNGRAWAWGNNSSGQLGDNSITSKLTPVSVLGAIKTFCQISAGINHSLAIDKNGRAWGWGLSSAGQLGDNSITSKLTPVSVLGAIKTFCQISAGASHSLAIDKNGRAWGWGLNSTGQLGDNSVTSRLTPVSVLGAVKTFCQISGGFQHSLAIDKNGRAWGWGANSSGPVGDNSVTSKRTPVSVLGAIKTFCQISAGNSFSLAIDKNGRAWTWGVNSSGQLGDNSITSRLTPVSVLGAVKTFCRISTGTSYSLAIDKNGRAWGWGLSINSELGQGGIIFVYTPVTIIGATKTFCQISTGDGFSLAIDKNGRAWAWGNNTGGKLGINSAITSQTSPVSVLGAVKTFCKITGGGTGTTSTFSLAIDKNGRLWSWGFNNVGQLGDNTLVDKCTPVSVAGAVKTFCEISNGPNQAFALAIDKNGQAWGWGINGNGQLGDGTTTSRRTPVSVAGTVRTFCKVSVGGFHSLAIDKNGRLWAWGNNSNGQLGNNATGTSVCSPVCVCGAIKTFCHIAGGNSQSIAIDKNGQAWGWGFNSSGANGDGGARDNLTPVSVQGQKKTFCKIASGNGVSLSIDNYGRLWAWGFNSNGQIGDSSAVPKRTPTRVCNTRTFCEVKGANNHVLAIEKNGNVWAWGNNNSGQLANFYIGSFLSPVSILGAVKTFCQISAGNAYSLTIDKNGRAWGWGYNQQGQLGVNSTEVYVTTPRSVYGNKTFCSINGNNSGFFTIAIDYQGRVWSWGQNTSNQLGTNNFIASYLTPVRVAVI
jgi:alpha-tubulin suppressor-like RCC1 family protein